LKRILITTLSIIALAATLSAQRGFGPRGGGTPLAALKNALDLTDAQVTAITALFQTEKTRMDAIWSEIEQKRRELDTLLNAASPVAVTVGNAAIALHTSELKIKTEQDSFISQIKQQLTGEQQAKLDTLLAARGNRGLLPGLGGPGPRGQSAPARR